MVRFTLALVLVAGTCACAARTLPSTWPVTVERQAAPSGDEWLELLGAPWGDTSVGDAARRAGGAQADGRSSGRRSQYIRKHRVILNWPAKPGLPGQLIVGPRLPLPPPRTECNA